MILSVNGISFAYRGVPVLEDVTFSLAEGEMAALLGPNGTGKTTLLRAINGILRPAGGTVLMESRDALACPPRERAKFFAYVPQRGEPVRLTVFDAVPTVPPCASKNTVTLNGTAVFLQRSIV